MEVRGSMLDHPNMHSVQIDEDKHLLASGGFIYMNHSFSPNCMLDIDDCAGEDTRIRVVSLRDIAPGEDLCFNYNTTEWELACPFVDLDTGRAVEGLKHATASEKLVLFPYLPAWLKARIASVAVTAMVPAMRGVLDG